MFVKNLLNIVFHSPKFKIAFPDIASGFELMEIADETD